ncbi:unnamed protein product [Cuscuta epithymum]|uniref:DYW domain-containing protein n=2 Tax=Cuscuta epithymum TaxID=186058 RepID=A0AAV0C4K3_9ASTE|nr:unnamed protein product [Cuscuta epithymum]CAH9136591.1 unnamed protein product [Cuscuta epithymum]
MVAVKIAANQRGRLTSSPFRFIHSAKFTSPASHSTLSSKESLCSKADYQLLLCSLEACKNPPNLRITTTTHCKMIKSSYAMNPSLLRLLIIAYISCNYLDPARELVNEILEWNFDVVSGNLMIVSFMKVKEVDAAKSIFTKMPSRDVVTWNSMIGGYVKNRLYNEALSVFKKMLISDKEPDPYTFASIMTACARLGDISNAKYVHNLMIERNIKLNYILSSALIDMYSKCGNIETAREIFSRVDRGNICVWNAMINGLATHGLASESVKVFSEIGTKGGVRPDSITFIALLTAFSHSGLVEEGKRHFYLMKEEPFSVQPQLAHYGVMVDILVRAGLLSEAYLMIKEMPMKPDVVIWRTFLSGCRIHKNSELGELAAAQISHLSSGDYVLMSNIYCSVNKWDSAEELRLAMKQKGVRKKRGRSWVEIGGIIHVFKAGDRSHPESSAIYKSLDVLIKLTKMKGFRHETGLVLMDISEEEKEENLDLHSEKLAIVYGILKTGVGDCIRVTKNLRTCPDCHSWIKVVSKVLNRVIVVRDRVRFHHFEGGFCTCADFW